jgi:hypothetical protein
MTRSAAEVEAEVEASRSELDRNVEALKQKMTPGQLFDEATRMAGGSGQAIASKFVEQAKANPMPLAVMGLGLAWLMVSNNRQQTSSSSYAYPVGGETRSFASEGDVAMSTGATYETSYASTTYEAGEFETTSGGGIKGKVQGIGQKASGLLSGAKDKVAGARHKVSDGASSMGQGGRSAMHGLTNRATDAAGTVRQKAGQVGQRAQQSFSDTMQSEPFMIAGLGLIVGAAIGAALPATAAEDRMLGEKRDQLLNRGKDMAKTGVQQASSAAQAAYGSVKSELQNSSGEGDLTERVETATRAGVQAARDEIQPGQAH